VGRWWRRFAHGNRPSPGRSCRRPVTGNFTFLRRSSPRVARTACGVGARRPASTHSLARPPTSSTASVAATPANQPLLGQWRQLNPPRAGREPIQNLGRSPQGEPRLTAPARARQRQQPRVLQHPLSSASSRSRPTKLDSATGRLCGRSTPGNGVTVPAPTSNCSACDMPASTSHSKPEPGQVSQSPTTRLSPRTIGSVRYTVSPTFARLGNAHTVARP
jgi:hypothetical protein